MPMYAGFRPDEEWLAPLWEYAQTHQLPVLLHTGTTFISQAPLECTLPRHLDPVACRYPELRMILAHLGHPYEGECIAVIRKHPHVYADLSALHYRPFQLPHPQVRSDGAADSSHDRAKRNCCCGSIDRASTRE
jgi:predicted TIM-barrel fold metal-dependent hydrolase